MMCRREVKIVGRSVINGNVTSVRADLMVRDGTKGDFVIEVSTTNPCSRNDGEPFLPGDNDVEEVDLPESVNANNTKGRKSTSRAEHREASKLKKYRDAGVQIPVIPFVVELFGRIGPKGWEFVENMVEKAAGRGINVGALRKEWLTRISCAFIKGLGATFDFSVQLYRGYCYEGQQLTGKKGGMIDMALDHFYVNSDVVFQNRMY